MAEAPLKKYRGKPVVVFDKWGRFIRRYLSITDCSRETGISYDKIRMLIHSGDFEEKIGLFFDFEV